MLVVFSICNKIFFKFCRHYFIKICEVIVCEKCVFILRNSMGYAWNLVSEMCMDNGLAFTKRSLPVYTT